MGSSSFSSSGNEERPTTPEEYDCVVRTAEVSLYDYDSTGIGLPTIYKHWKLVFEFVDGAVRVIEGIRFNGVLLPSFTKVNDPSAKFNSRRGRVRISPKGIRDLALNNPCNNKIYNYISCNCQNWVNEILKELRFDEETTVGEEVAWALHQWSLL